MAYFDNASTTFPKMKSVYEKTMSLYEEIGINFSRENNEISQKMTAIKSNLVDNIKKIFEIKGNKQIIINSSTTFSLNEILQGLDYNKIRNVYISPFEHNSVYRVLKKIELEKGINLEVVKFNQYTLDEEELKIQFLSKKPDLIVMTHASNVFGNILPVEKIFELGKKYSAVTVVDTAQTGGILHYDKIEKYSDFIVFSGHKNLYGPSGIGGYIINNPEIKLSPLLYGGTGIKSEEIGMPEDIPERFEAGSPNTLGIIGLKLATDELLSIGIDNIYSQKSKNLMKLYEILDEFKDELEIYSVTNNNVGIISLNSKYNTPQELEMYLKEYGIIVRSGMQCAPLAHKHIKTPKEGAIRLSVGYFNKEEDFIKLREALEEIL